METTSAREKKAQEVRWSEFGGWTVTCLSCETTKSVPAKHQREAIIEQWPCMGSDACTKMLCATCKKVCANCDCWTCADHLAAVDTSDPSEVWCEVCRKMLGLEVRRG